MTYAPTQGERDLVARFELQAEHVKRVLTEVRGLRYPQSRDVFLLAARSFLHLSGVPWDQTEWLVDNLVTDRFCAEQREALRRD